MTEPHFPKEELGMGRPSWEVAGLPAPPYAREKQERLLPRHWLREVWEARGLTQWTVTRRLTAHTPECPLSLSRLSHIEGGRLSLSNVKAGHMEGPRLVLDVPVSIWQRVFSEDKE